ncbi:MAG: OmpH family outer membrane protein [Bacteroidia bacterium]
MKSIIRKFALAMVFALCGGVFVANAQKLGYVDLQEVMVAMPEYKKANTDMEKYQKQLEDDLGKLQQEFQTKYKSYEEEGTKLSPTMREFKEKELRQLQERIQEFQQTAQEDSRKKEAELLKPIVEKAKSAIGQVAKEVGYTYVFDSNTAGMLYKPEGDDVTVLVKKKLGIVDAPPAPKTVAPVAPKK